jgi:hypothetical protein
LRLNLTGEKKQYIALSDEYYKIRLFEFPELHSLYTNLAFRKRFVNFIFPLGEDSLLVMFDDHSFFVIPKKNLVESENKGVIELTGSEELKTVFTEKKVDLLSFREGQELLFKIGTDKIYSVDFDAASNQIGANKVEVVFDAATHESNTLLVLENGGTFEADEDGNLCEQLFVACMDDNEYLIKNLKVL